MKPPLITLLTDFGTSDHYVAAMKGVILGICPEARLIDISHEIAPYAIPEAAYTLAQTWRCFPKGTVHLVVVDPGVGSARRAIAVEADEHYFVAPDNGVLTLVLANGARYRAREITADRWFRHPVSETFHGRDIFAPVAARLASGVALAKFGKLVSDCVCLGFAKPVPNGKGWWAGTVLKVDRFGNVITNFQADQYAVAGLRMKAGARIISRLRLNYAGAADGELFLLRGSSGFIEISCNQQNAGNMLGIGSGSAVSLRLPAALTPPLS